MLGNVLIVGGSASIAPEIIAVFSAECQRVAVTYRSPPAAAPAGNILGLTCDLEAAESRAAMVATLVAAGGGIDAVIVLSGAILGKSLDATTDEAMDRLVAVNLTGPARLLRDLLPVLNAGARVLLVSSIAGERGSFDPMYAATKGALIPFAKSLATWAGRRLTITVVAPGAIEDSTMVRDMSAERVAHHLKSTPTGELLTRADLARILFDLAQPHWRHANGAVIRINGGSYV
jgi:3-oxoacyl-[acyl-carrier protein] reductase